MKQASSAGPTIRKSRNAATGQGERAKEERVFRLSKLEIRHVRRQRRRRS
jgi:hypothetical protein